MKSSPLRSLFSTTPATSIIGKSSPKVGFVASLGRQYRSLGSGLSMIKSGCIRVLEGYKEVKERGLLHKRRDIWTVHRVKQDLKGLLPAIVFYAVPTLPFFFFGPLSRFAPNFLPSTFLDINTVIQKQLAISGRQNSAGEDILRDLESWLTNQGTEKLTARWNILQTKKETFKADSIIDIMPDLFTRFQLATLTTSQAAQWAKYAGLALPYFMPKARLLMWADWMLKDDRLIEKEGIKSLSLFELREASMIRGIPQSQKLESYRYYQKALQSHLTLSKKTQNYVKSKWMVDEARAKAMKKPLPPPWDSELTDTNLKSVLASAVILSRALQNSRRRI